MQGLYIIKYLPQFLHFFIIYLFFLQIKEQEEILENNKTIEFRK